MSLRDTSLAAIRANKALILEGEVTLKSIKNATEATTSINITVQEIPVGQHNLSAFIAARGDVNDVYSAPKLSPLHRLHNILHEFCYLLLGHEQTAACISITELSSSFPTRTRKLLGR